MWPLPLWKAYRSGLKSSVADLVNAGDGAGAITAALYLQEFVGSPAGGGAAGNGADKGEKTEEAEGDGEGEGEGDKEGEGRDGAVEGSKGHKGGRKAPLWFHIDFMGSKAGHAEPQGMRAVYEYIKREMWRGDR